MSRQGHSPLAPGSIIGILGGGQLGRMLSLAAARLGFKVHIYCPSPNGPAAQFADHEVNAPYDDLDAIKRFAQDCDVITYEFENVPQSSAAVAAQIKPLHPNATALKTAQDRASEKTFIQDTAHVRVAPFAVVNTSAETKHALDEIGLPAVLKTRQFGYDGKGQAILKSDTDCDAAFAQLSGHNMDAEVPCVLEAFVPFKREVSIVAARNEKGETAAYPLTENVHKNHMLHTSVSPTTGDNGQAQALAIKIMEALDYVGVMATEFFELEDGQLIVNEIAPRVHNSGHWTQDAGCVDQFELHIRAICGWPLGQTLPRFKMEMTNLVGDDVNDWEALAREDGTSLHLYGKSDPLPGRKMGHVNRVIDPLD